MRRRNKQYDLYIFIILLVLTAGYFCYNRYSSEDRGVKAYTVALESYKKLDYETAYREFARVPSNSYLKDSALFRQARCATNMDRKELAIKKYNKIVHSSSKSSIVPISEYNMSHLLYELQDSRAKKHFQHIIKKYPTSDYATASEYFLGLLETENFPKSGKSRKKAIDRAFIHFKTYIEKAPDGRYALKSAEEIKKLGVTLKNYDNLLISRVYYYNGDYETASKFLNKTTLADSWTDFAKNEFKLGNKDKAKYYTETGLEKYAVTAKNDDVYEVIDNYISAYPSRKEGIISLISKSYNSTGADYIGYLNCNEVVPTANKEACYRTLYEKYPNGQFSADALYNLFISKYLQKKYYDAQRLGFLHLKKFPNVKSSPAITYFMGRIAFKLKHYESANSYYKKTIAEYPDSYYAYRANYNLYKADGALPYTELIAKPVVFPYKKSVDNNLVVRLALLKDYDLVEELCKRDKFIQSWITYQKGDYTISAVMAREAMEELPVKPPFSDLRWRLIYPLHYYDKIYKYRGTNNPIILQSILKEESHFNPFAGSSVGAAGLMQLMPATYSETAKRIGLSGDIFSVDNNIKAGSSYYEGLMKVSGSKDLYAISAYNGGIGSVSGWINKFIYSDTDEFVEQIPYPETKNYVKKVLRSYWVYGNVYQ